MTSRFIYTAFITAVIALIALTIGSSALLMMALALLIGMLFSLVSVLLALCTVRVKVSFAKSTVERASETEYRVSVRYASFPPVGAVTFVLSTGEAVQSEGLPFKTCVFEKTRVFEHRGVYVPGDGRVYAEDMFSLFVFSKKLSASDESILVLPREKEFEVYEIRSTDIGPEAKKKFDEDASEPSGVRDWLDGDSLKRVHWKLTMKTYDPSLRNLRPMVRTYDEAARPDTIVLADLSQIDALEEWSLSAEDAICEMAYAAVCALLKSENSVRMVLACAQPKELVGENAAEKEAFRTLLAQAVFDGQEPFENAVYECARHPERTGALIVVTAHMNTAIIDALIRVRNTAGVGVTAVWITDQQRGDRQEMLARLESAGVLTHSINPLKDGE